MASNVAEARQAAEAIIGMQLVTHQTGPEGQKVKQVLVEKASDIDREYYLGITLDRAQSKLVVMASREGGVEIEEVAATHPEKILRETVDPSVGLRPFQATRMAFGLVCMPVPGATPKKPFSGLHGMYTMPSYCFFSWSMSAVWPIMTDVSTYTG